MSDLHRQPNQSDGLSTVKEREERESVPVEGGTPVDGPRAKAANDGSQSEPGHGSDGQRDSPVPLPTLTPLSPLNPISPSGGGVNATTSPNSLQLYQSRSPLFWRLSSRSSSGYFSFDADSVPSSPLPPRPEGVDKATQTPSLPSQAMAHALQRLASPSPDEVPWEPWSDHDHGVGGMDLRTENGRRPLSRCPSSGSSGFFPCSAADFRARVGVRDMQPEILIGQELRNIGDDFNHLLMDRQLAGRNGREMRPNLPPHIHQEPAFLLCMGLLLLLGVLYLQGRDGQPP